MRATNPTCTTPGCVEDKYPGRSKCLEHDQLRQRNRYRLKTGHSVDQLEELERRYQATRGTTDELDRIETVRPKPRDEILDIPEDEWNQMVKEMTGK